MMLLTRSRSTDLAFCSSGRRCWPAPRLAFGDLLEHGGGSEPGARGEVGSHSTNFSPSSDCGRIRQLASSRKSWKPGSSIRSTTTALPGSSEPSAWTRLAGPGDVDLVDGADAGAGDADLLAGDQEAAGVEDRPHLVGALLAAGRGRERASAAVAAPTTRIAAIRLTGAPGITGRPGRIAGRRSATSAGNGGSLNGVEPSRRPARRRPGSARSRAARARSPSSEEWYWSRGVE